MAGQNASFIANCVNNPPLCATKTTNCQGSDAVLIRLEGVGQHTEAGDADFHAVPSLERTHSGRSSGQYQVTGFQCEDGADICEQPGNGKDKVEGRGVLAQLAVDAGFQGQAGRGVQLVADDGANRAKGVEALGASPLSILAL